MRRVEDFTPSEGAVNPSNSSQDRGAPDERSQAFTSIYRLDFDTPDPYALEGTAARGIVDVEAARIVFSRVIRKLEEAGPLDAATFAGLWAESIAQGRALHESETVEIRISQN